MYARHRRDTFIEAGFPAECFEGVSLVGVGAEARVLSAAIRCGELSAGMRNVLLEPIVKKGLLSLAEEYLARGHFRGWQADLCQGDLDPTDEEEYYARWCAARDPCPNCFLCGIVARRRRPIRLSDWLWARCISNSAWHRGRLNPADFRCLPGHPILLEILTSPEIPKIARWLRNTCRLPEDKQLIAEALQQCARWEPRSAWAAAVVRAGLRRG